MAPCDITNLTVLCRGRLKYGDRQNNLIYSMVVVLLTVFKIISYDDMMTKELLLYHSSKIEEWPKKQMNPKPTK